MPLISTKVHVRKKKCVTRDYTFIYNGEFGIRRAGGRGSSRILLARFAKSNIEIPVSEPLNLVLASKEETPLVLLIFQLS